jgi:hypothetical protein
MEASLEAADGPTRALLGHSASMWLHGAAGEVARAAPQPAADDTVPCSSGAATGQEAAAAPAPVSETCEGGVSGTSSGSGSSSGTSSKAGGSSHAGAPHPPTTPSPAATEGMTSSSQHRSPSS